MLSACAQQAEILPIATTDPLLVDATAKPILLTTQDNVQIAGFYYPPPNKSGVPAILLLHMYGQNKESWPSFAKAAQESGYAVLAIDLRGHGDSGGGQNFELMDNDVNAALSWLLNRPEVNGERIGIVGASIGANLALRGGSSHPQVKSLVLLSPGLSYRGLTTLDALATYGQRPIMLVAAEGDAYSADSARKLNSQALGQHQLKIYPNNQHGTAIFEAQVGLEPMILAWFASTL